MQGFLKASQLTEKTGFSSYMPAYGGWGFDEPQEPGVPGHMDLAHTRRAIQALAVTNQFLQRDTEFLVSIADHAQHFLRVVQKHSAAVAPQPNTNILSCASAPAPPFDGGFYFSPVVLTANKGREETTNNGATFYRSYSTATCDGILALLAAGVHKDDQRVTAALAWLGKHTDLDYPQGVPTDHPEPWGAAIRYYHYAVRAEVYRALNFPAADRAALAATVAKLQRPDGSFVNTESPLMKEDDPILTTALAVIALSECQR